MWLLPITSLTVVLASKKYKEAGREARATSVLATALVADKISLKQNTYTPTAILTANKDEDSFEGNIHHCKQVYEPFIYYKVHLKW